MWTCVLLNDSSNIETIQSRVVGCDCGLNKVLSWNIHRETEEKSENSHDNQFPGRGSKRASPEYKHRVFPQTNLFCRNVLTLHWCEVISKIVLWDLLFDWQHFWRKLQTRGNRIFLNTCNHLADYTVSEFRKSQYKFSLSAARIYLIFILFFSQVEVWHKFWGVKRKDRPWRINYFKVNFPVLATDRTLSDVPMGNTETWHTDTEFVSFAAKNRNLLEWT